MVQLSLPAEKGWRELVQLGAHLRPLRSDGVWVVGSGGLVHNFRQLAWENADAPVASWATEVEARFIDQVRSRNVDEARRSDARAPRTGLRRAWRLD